MQTDDTDLGTAADRHTGHSDAGFGDGTNPIALSTGETREEPNPTASVDHWLSILSAVKVYRVEADGSRTFAGRIPVHKAEGAVSDPKQGIHIGHEALLAGTWIGERTLRLKGGLEVVFSGS